MKIMWGLFLFIFILSNLLGQAMIWSTSNEDKIIEKECYDRYGNEIKDLVCEEKRIGVPLNIKILISIFLLIFLFLLSLVISNLDLGGNL